MTVVQKESLKCRNREGRDQDGSVGRGVNKGGVCTCVWCWVQGNLLEGVGVVNG